MEEAQVGTKDEVGLKEALRASMQLTPTKPRRSRSDAGLPRKKSLTLSRAASARFARVAAQLKGGEAEFAELLEPILERLFDGKLVSVGDGDGSGPTLEDLAVAAIAARMKPAP